MSEIVLTDRPAVTLSPLTKQEAEVITAMDGVLRRYRLVEWIRCRTCYEAHREDGCRSVVSARLVRIECRCGVREFVAPVGTTDFHANRANSALTGANQCDITVVDGNGKTITLKSIRMEPEDAAICHLYSKIMGALALNPKFAHLDCWNRKPYDDSAMEVIEEPTKLALKCSCSVLHFDGSASVH